MALPSPKILARAFTDAQNTWVGINLSATDLRDASAAGPVSGKDIIDFSTRLAGALDTYAEVKATPGIAQYARDQLNNQAFDVVTEFASHEAEVVACRDWIVANFPSTGGYLQILSFDVNGRYVYRTLTTAQTAGLRTQLDLLIATVS